MKTIDDTEMLAIKNSVSYFDVCEFFKGKEVGDMRLPLNNRKAFEYLVWANRYYSQNDYLTYVINIFSMMYGEEIFNKIKETSKPDNLKIIRPPTINEEVVTLSKIIANIRDDNETRSLIIDTNVHIMSDAVYHTNYPAILDSGIAAAFIKFGTWEDNPTDFDFVSFEESI